MSESCKQMTPLEVAKKLETMGEIIWKNSDVDIFIFTRKDAEVLHAALSYVQRVASGEYKPVVHAHWIPNKEGWPHCSNCSEYALEDSNGFPVKSNRCPFCGALMDGKDDSHETN